MFFRLQIFHDPKSLYVSSAETIGATVRHWRHWTAVRHWRHWTAFHTQVFIPLDMSNLMQTMSPRIGRIGKKLFPGAVRHRQHLGHRPAPPAACASEP
jgi:hypothetical protein